MPCSLADGLERLVAREWEGRVTAIALEDFSGRLAVGGWFDEVAVFDLAAGRLLHRHVAPRPDPRPALPAGPPDPGGGQGGPPGAAA